MRLLRLVVLLRMSICHRDAAMRATTRLLGVCVDALRSPALDTGRARTVRGCSDSRGGSRVRVHQTVTLLAPESTQEYTYMTLQLSATNVRSDVSPRCLAKAFYLTHGATQQAVVGHTYATAGVVGAATAATTSPWRGGTLSRVPLGAEVRARKGAQGLRKASAIAWRST